MNQALGVRGLLRGFAHIEKLMKQPDTEPDAAAAAAADYEPEQGLRLRPKRCVHRFAGGLGH